MLSASDAALMEEGQGSLDKASWELAEEVKELIDERNDVEKASKDREEVKEEQSDEAEGKEQARLQEKMLQPEEEQGRGAKCPSAVAVRVLGVSFDFCRGDILIS